MLIFRTVLRRDDNNECRALKYHLLLLLLFSDAAAL